MVVETTGVPVVACLHDRASATGLDNDGLAPTVARFDALSESLAGGEAYPGERSDVLAKVDEECSELKRALEQDPLAEEGVDSFSTLAC